MAKNHKDVERFVEFITMVVNKPGMFNVNNIEDLNIVLFGYLSGAGSTNITGEHLNDMMLKFRKFINEEFNSREDHDWARLIRFYSAGDMHSLELFKSKFEKFMDK